MAYYAMSKDIVGRCSKCTCAECVDFHKYKDAGPASSEEFQMLEEFLHKTFETEIYRLEWGGEEKWKPKHELCECDSIYPRVRQPYRRFIDLVYDRETYDGGEMGPGRRQDYFFATYDRELKNITMHERICKEMSFFPRK